MACELKANLRIMLKLLMDLVKRNALYSGMKLFIKPRMGYQNGGLVRQAGLEGAENVKILFPHTLGNNEEIDTEEEIKTPSPSFKSSQSLAQRRYLTRKEAL